MYGSYPQVDGTTLMVDMADNIYTAEPCKHCGGQPMLKTHVRNAADYIICNTCGMRTSGNSQSMKKLVDVWNGVIAKEDC